MCHRARADSTAQLRDPRKILGFAATGDLGAALRRVHVQGLSVENDQLRNAADIELRAEIRL